MILPEGLREPKLILDLGSGEDKRLEKQWPKATILRLDILPLLKPDIVADLRWLPLADESVDWAYSNHTLEHIPWSQVELTLAEWVRVIKSGGVLRVGVPDLGWIAQQILWGHITDGTQAGIYGSQHNEYEFHRSGYTLPLLVGLMENAGLMPIEAERQQFGVKTMLPNRDWSLEPMGEIYCIGVKR